MIEIRKKCAKFWIKIRENFQNSTQNDELFALNMCSLSYNNMVKSRLKFKRLLLLLKPRSNALFGTSLVYKGPTILMLFATIVTETSMILTRTRWNTWETGKR